MKVTETQEFRRQYYRNARDARALSIINTPIVCYRGKVDMKIGSTHFVDKDPSKRPYPILLILYVL
jgi:hypothetical protein